MKLISYERSLQVWALLQHKQQASFPLISAVLKGLQKGKVFVDDEAAPTCVFVLTNYGFSQYFLLKDDSFTEDFIDFLVESDKIPYYFHLYDPIYDIDERLMQKGLVPKLRERKQLRYLSKDPVIVNPMPNGYSLHDMNEIEFNSFEQFNLDLGSRFWSSRNAFIKNAFGKCIVYNEGTPVSVCYSACIANGIAEIDIATLIDHQGKGLGKIVTQAFINESISKNIIANWDCFSENRPSLRVAEETGFKVLKTYSFLSVYNKKKHEKESN